MQVILYCNASGVTDNQSISVTDTNWTLVFQDDFDGTTVNTKDWCLYYCGGHQGNGLRRPSAITTANGVMKITAQMVNGTLISGAMSHLKNYTYGKFEFRVKADADLSGVTSAVVLTWPKTEVWPDDGENDIFETNSSSNPNRTYFETNILSGVPLNKWSKGHYIIDAKQWHVVAMEWLAESIKIYIDGELKWTQSDPTLIVDQLHHLCIQLDAFKPTMTGTTSMYIDWVKIYQPTVVSEVSSPEVNNSIQVYPNPVSDYLDIKSPDNQKIESFGIYSMDGKSVKSNGDATLRIDCSNLKAGLYYMKANFRERTETVRFFKI